MIAILRLIKYLLVIFIAFTLTVILALAYYDYQYFQPRIKSYDQIKPLPDAIFRLLDAEHGEALKFSAGKELIPEINANRAGVGHLKRYIWGVFTGFHLSHEKQVQVIVSTAYFDRDIYGFHNAANKFFDKTLQELSVDELALLVVRSRSPSYYNENQSSLEKKAAVLLSRAGYAS